MQCFVILLSFTAFAFLSGDKKMLVTSTKRQ